MLVRRLFIKKNYENLRKREKITSTNVGINAETKRSTTSPKAKNEEMKIKSGKQI